MAAMQEERCPLDLEYLIRPNILHLDPYRCARDEFQGQAQVFLDANENGHGPVVPIDGDMHRYPSPFHNDLKEKIAEFRKVKPEQIFLGVGSDEAIDMAIRVFCEPGRHAIMVTPPTYGMYKVVASINNVSVQSVPLKANFQLAVDKMIEAISPDTRLLFLCSPNNPSGNTFKMDDIEKILTKEAFTGMIVVDEAYIDFAHSPSLVTKITTHPRIIVLQTLSKSFGLAGIRLGMAFAHPSIIKIFNNVKAPYNVSRLSADVALRAFDNLHRFREINGIIRKERDRVFEELYALPCVEEVYESEANFILFRVRRAHEVYTKMADRGIILRFRGNQPRCENCLRFTISKREENQIAIEALKEITKAHEAEEDMAGLPPYKKARLEELTKKPNQYH